MRSVSSIAIRVHRLDQMTRFYSQAFGIRFEQVDTYGIRSYFGDLDGIVLKLVPIRETVDFEGFPVHQIGFQVPDVERVIRLAEEFGGRQEGDLKWDAGALHAAVRDPDGNTLELYCTVISE